MKAITIIEPYATLIALDEKRFETRSWAAKHRGPIAIHAGKKIDRKACESEPIKSTLAKHGYTADNLPAGSVVAIVNLSDSKAIHMDHTGDAVLMVGGVPTDWIGQASNEFAFGWYDDGRYAWELANVQRLAEPVPAKGQQGLWNWEEVKA